jgi:hypothetical protein
MAFTNESVLRHAERVLCYLVHTRDLGLRFRGDQQDLLGSADASWEVTHSTSGQTFQYNSATISWGSKKQPSIALSSCEAEIMATSEAAKEAVYLTTFLEELELRDPIPIGPPVTLQCDNKGAPCISSYHSRRQGLAIQ